jgi:hypothetical protein
LGLRLGADLLVLDLAGLDPRLDLVPVALQLLDLLLEVGLELLLLVGILGVVDLPKPRNQSESGKINRNRDVGEEAACLVPDAVEDVDALLDLLEDAVDLSLQLPAGAHGIQSSNGEGGMG